MTLGAAFQLGAIYVWSPELLLVGRFVVGLFSPLCDVVLVLYLQVRLQPRRWRGQSLSPTLPKPIFFLGKWTKTFARRPLVSRRNWLLFYVSFRHDTRHASDYWRFA